MKLPDKVYLNKFMIRPGMLHPAEFPPDNPEEEYIRKDALLEWAKKELKRYSEDTQWEFGYSRALRDLIDKLNSL